MQLFLFSLTALALGIALGWFYAKSKNASLLAEISQLNKHNELLKQQRLEAVRQLQEQIQSERQTSQQNLEQQMRIFNEKLSMATAQLHQNATEQLQAQQAKLQQTNCLQIDQLFQPVKEQLDDFRKAVVENSKMSALHKQELSSTFDATLKLYEQIQHQTVTDLREATTRIGNDAAQLTKALKGDSKIQGDWGEMILDSLLENCGLRRGEEYLVQENVKDKNGNNFRPDVVVRFPENRSLIIDSKVSLTAYANATAATDESERKRFLKEHVASLRRHVDELAKKDYSDLVSGSIGFVLMFVPNESSYIAAMKQDPTLSQYAYNKQVVIISPSNLLISLKLAYNLWQYDRQTKNVENIVKQAGALYDKVAGFIETFKDIDKHITSLRNAFDKANGQLSVGKGNIISKIQHLEKMGVTPKKTIKQLSNEENDSAS